MWPFKKSKIRRRELHRQRPERGWLWRRGWPGRRPWPVLVAGLFVVGATTIVLYGGEALPYRVGQRVSSKILAPWPFRRENAQKTLAAIKQARLNTPSVYVFNEALVKRIEGLLTELVAAVKASDSYESFAAQAAKRGWPVDQASYAALRKLTEQPGQRRFESWLRSLRRLLADEPIVRKLNPAERDSQALRAVLKGGPRGTVELSSAALCYVSDAEGLSRRMARVVQWLGLGGVEKALTSLLVRQIQAQAEPIWIFDKKQTDALLARAEGQVPVIYDEYQKGETLVGPGVIDEQEYLLLQDAWRAYRQVLRSEPELARQRFLVRLGTGGLVALLTAGVGLYVLMYQPRVVQNPARSVALGALLLVMLLVCRMIEMLGTARGAAAEWTVLPVVMTGAILSIAYNQRFALGVTGAFCILATMAVSGGLELFVVLLVVAGVTVFMLAEVRTRLKILEVGGLSAVAAFAAVFFVGLMGRQELSYIIEHAGWAALAGLVAALLIQAILPLIERLFGIVTAMTLLEWCDVNKPLLKRLAQEAPGTYNHSLVLGSLAEAAAEQIGANGLLVRVGAYYHDIGKINKPDYFVENYQSQTDRHEKLSPTMSLLIIVGHVKDGIEMAREYGLPPVLHQFIAEHHGTTVVQYFYHAAAERRQAEGKGGVAEAEFRYPGPTPRSKESAILMLCDGVEGAVRALQEPTPGRIEATVHQIAMQRLMDGQLDDCDITLKELERVEESLVKSLCAIYHGRISYPRAAAVAQRGSRTA